MKTAFKVTILTVLTVLLITACQPAPTAVVQAPTAVPVKPTEAVAQPTAVPTEAPKKVVKVALVLPGMISDAGWNAEAYDGLKAAKDQLGVEVAYTESVKLADFDATFRDYANQGYNLIIGHGSEFSDVALAVAKDYPNTYFAVTNSNVKAANVAGMDTKNEENGYMAGFIAGTITKAKKVGYLGAMEIVAMKRSEEGFKLGAKAACPDCEVVLSYIGSFDDIGKGKDTGLAMIDKGVDVMFPFADASGLGALEAAQDKKILAVGAGYNQKEFAPKAVVVSLLSRNDVMIVSLVKEVQEGNFKANTVRLFGYDTGSYFLSDFDMSLVTQEQVDKIKAAEAELKAGKVQLPHLSASN